LTRSDLSDGRGTGSAGLAQRIALGNYSLAVEIENFKRRRKTGDCTARGSLHCPLMQEPKLKGMSEAAEFARSGKFIFATKLLERLNPEITREQAKQAVASLGYGRGSTSGQKKTQKDADPSHSE
jgi:hypothetical protein